MKTIPLTQGKVALVDDADYPALAQFKWSAARRGKCWYAQRRVASIKKTIYMHRQLLGFPPTKTDHRNGNGLDNQRENLRAATQQQNAANCPAPNVPKSSRFKGVYFHKRLEKWAATIVVNQKGIYLGVFGDEQDAARAYDTAARAHFGEFARTNL